MSITVTEKLESGRLGTTDGEKLYVVRGTASTTAAYDAVSAAAPSTVGGLSLQEISVEPVFVDSTNAAVCIWEGRARYAPPEEVEKEVGESSFSFRMSGGTQHITQSLATTSYPAGAPDVKGAIGATADGVEGVDVVVPTYEFSETHVIDNAKVTDTYRGRLFGLTGKVNSATFRGLAAGECLFLGADGSRRGDGAWEITFSFAGSPNVTGRTIGGISDIAKKGWEYLWVRYETFVDNDAQALVQRPESVYVEKVYESDDFTKLDPDWTAP